MDKLLAALGDGKPARLLELDSIEREHVQGLALITAKPVLYIANVAEDGFTDNPLLEAVEAVASTEHAGVVPVCAAIESELIALEAEERAEFLAEMGLEEPGLNRVIRAGYELLGLQTFLTSGPKESRAWTIPRRLYRTAGRRQDSHRLCTRIHTSRDSELRRLRALPRRARCERGGQAAFGG